MKNKENRRKIVKENFLRYLGAEIWIEYKACLYSFCMMVFYCIYLLCRGIYQASILVLFEMVVTAYVMGYAQVYLLKNFDESDRLGRHEISSILMCSAVYTLVSFVLTWFERNLPATGLFFLFMLFSFGCVCVVNRLRRIYDTRNLNRMLEEFKRGCKYGKCD